MVSCPYGPVPTDGTTMTLTYSVAAQAWLDAHCKPPSLWGPFEPWMRDRGWHVPAPLLMHTAPEIQTPWKCRWDEPGRAVADVAAFARQARPYTDLVAAMPLCRSWTGGLI